jgi:VanZ family protein
MSASPLITPSLPPHPAIRRSLRYAWIAVCCGVAVICVESSPFGGGNNTGRLLHDLWPNQLARNWNPAAFGLVHHLLRKLGHFTGYGTLSLLFNNAWHRSARFYLGIIGGQLRFAAYTLAVAFTFFIGCMDEWHQKIVPGRTSTFHDVLIDTSGALCFNIVLWAIRIHRRRKIIAEWFPDSPPAAR